MNLYLVHHGDAVGPEIDPRRPLSTAGRTAAELAAVEAAALGARPSIVWHSGKLRARQTAEIFWRACNALAECSATRDLQPADPPAWIRDRLREEPRDVMIVGHFPHLPLLFAMLMNDPEASAETFPLHGAVAMKTTDQGASWAQVWKIDASR